MFIELTEEQRMLQQSIRAFATDVIRPRAESIDKDSAYPADIVAQLSELGLMGVTIPEEWGGSGMDQTSYAIAAEEISAACASVGVTMSAHNSLVCDPLNRFGTDAQKEQWLKPLAQGKKIGCYALSEPSTGSDAANQTTVCERDGDGWILNGTKNFITNGPIADVIVVFAMHDRSLGYKGITAFVVDMHQDGVSCGAKEHKLGIKGSPCSSVTFEDCRVDGDAMLGSLGEGFKVAMTTLDGGRIGIAAQAIGIAREAYEEALQYSMERHAFGGPISNLQAIQHKLADMATDVDASRLLTYRAATLKQAGKKYSKQGSKRI